MAAESVPSSVSTESPPNLIFLCYARSDRDHVEKVAAALRARGASVWYDAGSAAGGASYVESVQRALKRTGLMLVFVSASSVKSAWVADELRAYRSLMAREPGHKLLTIHLDRTRAPLALHGVGAVDAHNLSAEDAVKLIASAGGVSLAEAQPYAAPQPVSANGASPAPAPARPPAPQAPAPVSSGQVFVSYDRTDSNRIQPLVTALRGLGVQVWNDNGAAHGGQGYVETAGAALAHSRTLLVAVSASSATSPWVTNEVREFQSLKARDAGRAIIAMHLDMTPAPLILNGASAVDAQSLAPHDTARLIANTLPAASLAAPASAPVATPAPVVVTPAAVATPAPVMAAPGVAAPVMAEPVVAAPVMAAPGVAAPVMAEPVVAAPVMEAAPVAVAPPMEETTPAMKAVAPVETAPAQPAPVVEKPMAAPATAVEMATPIAATPAVAPVAAPVADEAHPATTPKTTPTGWRRMVGPVALVIVLLIALMVALWIYAGYPLPGQ